MQAGIAGHVGPWPICGTSSQGRPHPFVQGKVGTIFEAMRGVATQRGESIAIPEAGRAKIQAMPYDHELPASEATFSKLLESLVMDTAVAESHWRLYKDLQAAVPEYVREFNESVAFWRLTFDAHLDVTLFRLARLYDDQANGNNLPNLIVRIEVNLTLFDEPNFRERLKDNPFVESLAVGVQPPDAAVLHSDKAQVSKTDPLVKRLHALRNQVLAHRSPGVVLDAGRNITIAEDDVASLLLRAHEVVNRYSILFRASSTLGQLYGQEDFRGVLNAVRKRREALQREFDVELAKLSGTPEPQ